MPRPVVNGRIRADTIPDEYRFSNLEWSEWAEVNPDGTFEIPAWPKNTPMQLIALCDGYIAKPGSPPEMVDPKRARSDYSCPQVFMQPESGNITVEMNPLKVCRINAVNAFGKKLDDVAVIASPNVQWWNIGSQMYAWPVYRSADTLAGKLDFEAFYQSGIDQGNYSQPFKEISDANGSVSIELPNGRHSLYIGNDRFHLPANLGSRSISIEVKEGEPFEMQVVLQPKGLDVLGDWEDLCGLVFG